MKKNPLSSIGGMLDGVLARHGIAKQVLATQVVMSANELLKELLSQTAKNDIKALSLKDGILTLACKHTVALYDAEGVGPTLSRRLEEIHPSVSLKVVARLRPEAFMDGV